LLASRTCCLELHMKFLLPLFLALLTATHTGCRKKPSAPPPPVPAPAPAPGAAPEGTPTNPGNAAEMAFSNATVLTMMLQEFEAQNKRLPTTIKDLEAIKTYGPIPPAPPGFRYAIDAKKKQVVAVKQ